MTPHQVLGLNAGASPAEIQQAFRALARKHHPDHGGKEEDFQRINGAYQTLIGAKSLPLPVIGGWEIQAPVAKGDLCSLYLASKNGEIGVLKIPASESDNDLMLAEREALARLESDAFGKYYPRLLDSFKASGRYVTVMSQAVLHIALSDLKVDDYAITFHHSVWMLNRLLSALGFSHRRGIIHGSILPQHLLYHPVDHGMRLVDWCASVKVGEPLKFVVKDCADYYPPEIKRKLPATPGMDLYMAFASIKSIGNVIPRRFIPLFDWAMSGSPHSRPEDAWELQGRVAALAREEYGDQRYVELKRL